MVQKSDVLEALAKVKGPDLEGDLVSLGLVSDPVISGSSVMFAITVDAGAQTNWNPCGRRPKRRCPRSLVWTR
jgi:ATP-binding protein involved in chromosome partitioning